MFLTKCRADYIYSEAYSDNMTNPKKTPTQHTSEPHTAEYSYLDTTYFNSHYFSLCVLHIAYYMLQFSCIVTISKKHNPSVYRPIIFIGSKLS